MKCILCKSPQLRQIERVNKDKLSFLYKKAFGGDVSKILLENLIFWHCESCDLRFFSLENGEIPSGDNDFYNALNKIEWYYMSEKNEYHFAKNFINDSTKVLEVGCGKAAFREFLPQGAREKYIGLEFSSDAKEMAAKNNINIQNIAIEDFAKSHKGEFDVACSFQVLEHVSNPNEFIKAQIECLRNAENISRESAINGGGGIVN
ncbi:methyltransferase [Helicobacter sp. 16-1353]|uniref:class I SAM-dependent methyltransferase n=1 Tax=Helicobacter sp. 16-1353 TaxID=2004996 RepID=UPI000DCD3B0E|nr:methyltransferase domain-containing protein [Helicobacter sp. 16-1353]RAX52752.1 methyltransferase [Helicobacter sp. 16-1353]